MLCRMVIEGGYVLERALGTTAKTKDRQTKAKQVVLRSGILRQLEISLEGS